MQSNWFFGPRTAAMLVLALWPTLTTAQDPATPQSAPKAQEQLEKARSGPVWQGQGIEAKVLISETGEWGFLVTKKRDGFDRVLLRPCFAVPVRLADEELSVVRCDELYLTVDLGLVLSRQPRFPLKALQTVRAELLKIEAAENLEKKAKGK